ncbi:MAG: histidine--tRNA ligase family protein [Dehalococcoidales bacterium]|nr:MAG: histidine--tRNA ligase family protein [Dehalococcoidales bacterium]
MRVQRCKGTRDLSPEEMRRFRIIEGVFSDSCLKWGYQEVKTPTLEYLHLFTSTGTLTPGRLGRVYSFLDWDGWSGERVVLRPDGTIPIARLYIDTMEDRELAKLFYVTNVFSFEETGKESREKWQCGAELIGAGSVMADVELVILALEVVEKLGFEGVELRLSHADLIRALLAKFKLNRREQARMFDQILDGDPSVLNRIKVEQPVLARALTTLLDLKGKSSGFLQNVKALFNHDLPELVSPLNNFITVVELLESLDISCYIDITSVRGFEYYTGLIFQLFTGEESIGRGGRYDALIPLMGGGDIPASGFALYLEPLMSLVEPLVLTTSPVPGVLIKADPAKGAIQEALAITSRLHKAGFAAEIYLGGREPSDLRWTLDIREEGPRFEMADRFSGDNYHLDNAEQVIAQLGPVSAP